MDEKRLLVVMGLWLLLLAAYPLFFPSVAPPPTLPSPAASGALAPSIAPAPAVPAPTVAPDPAVATLADQSERRVELSGRDIELAFTNRGGRLLSWRLKAFKDSRGRPEEMVPPAIETIHLRPLDIETGDKALDEQLQQALFVPSTVTAVASEHGRAAIEFQFASANVTARKRIEIPGRGYAAQVEVEVTRQGARLPVRIVWGPGLGNPSPGEKELREYEPPRGAYLDAASVERIASKKLENARAVSSPIWIGVESQFFAALFAPSGPKLAGELRALPGPPEGDKVEWNTVATIEASEAPVTLYVGPKEHSLLSAAGNQLDRAVDVNWLKPIVLPLLTALRWLNGHIGNYGWSLIALTVLINLAMAPLRHKSIANGLKMSKLAPEMRVIQDRYKKIPALDPRRQEMQREISELYGRHGMNMGTQMLVGCLPMLLTMPFLFAMYQLLHVSIEMRGAPFLWIPDLSHKDPLYITPLLMGVSMFITNKMMPSTMDPAQQRVMMLMPIMFLGMFLWAPAGLNLYWLASNVCSIAQQGLTLSLLRREEAQGTKARKRS